MQRLDETKRQAITKTAAKMFAAKPFHEVRLEDVAAAAKISKGTVYLYYKNKEDLYDSLMLNGFDRLNHRLGELAAGNDGSQWGKFESMVSEFVKWAYENPHFFQIMRHAGIDRVRPKLKQRRQELGETFEKVMREGVAAGEIRDPHPEITAQFVPALVRSAFRHGPAAIAAAELTAQILLVLGRGVRVEGK